MLEGWRVVGVGVGVVVEVHWDGVEMGGSGLELE